MERRQATGRPAMMGFLARWARRLSWRETAQVFQTSWEAVYRSVEWFVQWGLAHRRAAEGVESVGLDEIHWGQGKRADNFLTVIYQIDCSLPALAVGGTAADAGHLAAGLEALGPEVVQGLRFICSDMWQPYLRSWPRKQVRPCTCWIASISRCI